MKNTCHKILLGTIDIQGFKKQYFQDIISISCPQLFQQSYKRGH